jgi:UDP-glucose 4-epimerase
MEGRLYRAAHVALRYGNVYGPRQDPHGEAGVVAIFFGKLLEGQPPLVFGDGLQTRDFVHISDVVRANLLAATSDRAPGEVINVGSGKSASLLELIATLKQVIGPTAQRLEIEHQAPRVGDLRASSADISKARVVLGYEPRVQLAQGLAEVVEFFRRA